MKRIGVTCCLCFLGIAICFAQDLSGKWRWFVKGNSNDIQSDYLVEMDLKQQGKTISGTRTLYLRNFPDVIIEVTGNVNSYNQVELNAGKVLQYQLPAKLYVAKIFRYTLQNDVYGGLDGLARSYEDPSVAAPDSANLSTYNSVYKSTFQIHFVKVPDTVGNPFKPNVKPPEAPPAIKTVVQHTIIIPQGDILLQLYDNGTIDGDIITLLIDNKPVLQHQKLGLSPIEWKIKNDDLKDSSMFIMRAENLGDIPPNTALMLMTVAGKRYDLNLSSTLDQQAGVLVKREKKMFK